MKLRNLETTTNHNPDLPFLLSTNPKSNLQKGIKVYVQSFRGLPLRLRVQDDWNEFEDRLPDAFQEAADEVLAQTGELEKGDNCWFLYGYRHGSLKGVAKLVINEILNTIDEKALLQWKKAALKDTHKRTPIHSIALVCSYLKNNPLSFNNIRSQALKTSTSLYQQQKSLSLSFSYHTSNPHEPIFPQELSKEIDTISGMIKAMNTPSQTMRRYAIQYFTDLCNTRIDRYYPTHQS